MASTTRKLFLLIFLIFILDEIYQSISFQLAFKKLFFITPKSSWSMQAMQTTTLKWTNALSEKI